MRNTIRIKPEKIIFKNKKYKRRWKKEKEREEKYEKIKTRISLNKKRSNKINKTQ